MRNIVERPKFVLSSVYNPFFGKIVSFIFYTVAVAIVFLGVFKDSVDLASSLGIGIFVNATILSLFIAIISPLVIRKYNKSIESRFYDDHFNFIYSSKYCYSVPYASVKNIHEKSKSSKNNSGGLVDIFIETEGLKLEEYPNFEEKHLIVLHNLPYSEGPLLKIKEVVTRCKQRLPVAKGLH